MSESTRNIHETIRESFVDQITGESESVSAVAGAPQAAQTISTGVYNPSGVEAKHGARSSAFVTIERYDDQKYLHEWLREYKHVRQEFQDRHVERARQLSKSSPAMGIIAARQVLEIPYRGKTNMMFMEGGGVWLRDVAEAFGENYDYDKTPKLHRAVFNVPEKIRDEMRSIIVDSRTALGAIAVQPWQEAASGYQELTDLHAEAMSLVELGKVFINEDDDSRENALKSFSDAVSLITDKLYEYPLYPPVEDIVEVDEMMHHLKYGVKSVITFDADPSRVVDVLKVKQAAYRLDDYGVSRSFVLDAYKYLTTKTPFGHGKLFFKRETKEMEAGIKTGKLLDRHSVIIGNLRFRKDYRNKRP